MRKEFKGLAEIEAEKVKKEEDIQKMNKDLEMRADKAMDEVSVEKEKLVKELHKR